MQFATLLVSSLVCWMKVSGSGVPLPIGQDDINQASATNTMEKLFTDSLNAHPIVMFTKSTCSLSRKARSIMNDNYPNVDYHYYEYDTQPLGDYFMYNSIQKSGTLRTPQIYVCDQFIGGASALQALHQNGQVVPTVEECQRRKRLRRNLFNFLKKLE